MNYQPLKYIYQASEKNNAPTLLLLHGTGGDETDLLQLADHFGDHFNILSLRGNVSEHGMPRFFKRLGMGIFDEEDVAFRTHEMVHFIKDLAAKEGFDVNKMVALGYSNGANIAGSTLLLYPDFLAGAILYRPMQPFKNVDFEVKNTKRTPVFMSSGLTDPTVKADNTTKYVALLKQSGFDVSNYDLPTSHNLTQQDIRLSVEWFNKYFGYAGL